MSTIHYTIRLFSLRGIIHVKQLPHTEHTLTSPNASRIIPAVSIGPFYSSATNERPARFVCSLNQCWSPESFISTLLGCSNENCISIKMLSQLYTTGARSETHSCFPSRLSDPISQAHWGACIWPELENIIYDYLNAGLLHHCSMVLQYFYLLLHLCIF